MATVRRVEDLVVWSLARQQCKELNALVNNGSLQWDKDLAQQMNRSSASVMDCITEGFERFMHVGFRRFLIIAKDSDVEFRSQLYRMLNRSFTVRERQQKLFDASEEPGRRLYAFIRHLTNTDIKDKSYPKPGRQPLDDPGMPYKASTTGSGKSATPASGWPDTYKVPAIFLNQP